MINQSQRGGSGGRPEPERPSRRPERWLRSRGELRQTKAGANRELYASLSVPQRSDNVAFGLRRRGAIRGAGKKNPTGVSDRNTPQGSRRGKPSGSWKTAKADRSGPGNPRRGGSRNPGLRSWGEGIAGKWTPRTGSAEGERNPREDGRVEGSAFVGRPGSADREADEYLEGERKAMSGIQPEGKPTGRPLGEKRQGPSRKAQRTKVEP